MTSSLSRSSLAARSRWCPPVVSLLLFLSALFIPGCVSEDKEVKCAISESFYPDQGNAKALPPARVKATYKQTASGFDVKDADCEYDEVSVSIPAPQRAAGSLSPDSGDNEPWSFKSFIASLHHNKYPSCDLATIRSNLIQDCKQMIQESASQVAKRRVQKVDVVEEEQVVDPFHLWLPETAWLVNPVDLSLEAAQEARQ